MDTRNQKERKDEKRGKKNDRKKVMKETDTTNRAEKDQ